MFIKTFTILDKSFGMIECLKGSKKFNIQEKDYTLN